MLGAVGTSKHRASHNADLEQNTASIVAYSNRQYIGMLVLSGFMLALGSVAVAYALLALDESTSDHTRRTFAATGSMLITTSMGIFATSKIKGNDEPALPFTMSVQRPA